MEEETKFERRRAEIVLYLADCALVKSAGGFSFDHQLVVDDHVEPLMCHFLTLVKDRHRDFATNIVPSVS